MSTDIDRAKRRKRRSRGKCRDRETTAARGALAALPSDVLPTMAEVERAWFEVVRDRCDGNMSAIARATGVDRRTLYRLAAVWGWPAQSRSRPRGVEQYSTETLEAELRRRGEAGHDPSEAA